MTTPSSFRHKTFNWLLTILLVILVMATPALADVIANSVGSPQIIDRSIKTVDIAKGAVKAKKIAKGAVNSGKIADGSIKNVDIAAGAAIAASKINRSGLDADLLDGKDGGDFVGKTGSQSINGGLTVSSLTYDSLQTGYVSVVGSAAAPTDSADAYTLSLGELWTSEVGDTRFEAPVSLPHGAVVTNFRYIAYDNDLDAGDDTDAWLLRKSATGSFAMAFAGPSTDSALRQTLDDNTISLSTVDNTQYAYYIRVRLGGGSNLRAGMFIVTYQYQSPGS